MARDVLNIHRNALNMFAIAITSMPLPGHLFIEDWAWLKRPSFQNFAAYRLVQ